jgi:prefoldin subunit 5
MENKQHAEKIVQIIKEYKSRPNKDLEIAMDFLKEDFEKTKESLLKLTNHLDKVESSYNLLLKEYQSRNQTL